MSAGRGPENRGFSLAHLMAALAAITVLALVVPATSAFLVNRSRVARAETDVREIAEAISRFARDTGFVPAWSRTRDGGPGAPADRLDLLIGPGEIPRLPSATPWVRGRTDTFANQLAANVPGYQVAAAATGMGWRGPYLARDIGPDPWNNRYVANIGLAANDGQRGEDGRLAKAIWVLSAGPNGVIETMFDQRADQAVVGGDDIGARVK